MDTRMVDDDLKTLLREFRSSVAEDLDAVHRRIDGMSDEVRHRITTAETAILDEIRDQGRRLERVSARVGDLEQRVDRIDPGSSGS